MSGGIAYVYDPSETFAGKVNMEMVELERVETEAEAAELRSYLEQHVERTGSGVAGNILSAYDAELPRFVKVMPTDYKRVLEQMEAEEDAAAAAA